MVIIRSEYVNKYEGGKGSVEKKIFEGFCDGRREDLCFEDVAICL